MTDYDETILYHYGIKRRSGRYPYGSGDRPFQGESGSFPKKKNPISRAIQKNRAKKAAQKEMEDRWRQQKAAAAAAQKEANREQVLRSGNATQVLEYIDSLSAKEIDEILKRLNNTNSLKALSSKEQMAAWDSINSIMTQAGQVANWIETGNKFLTQFELLFKNLGADEKPSGNRSGNKK